MPLFAHIFAAFRPQRRFTGTYPTREQIDAALHPWDNDTLGDWPKVPKQFHDREVGHG